MELDKKKMQLPEPIRTFGVTEVAIKLHPKVVGKFKRTCSRGIGMEETLINRTMPNSREAEQSVIGSMIMDKDAILTAMEMLIS